MPALITDTLAVFFTAFGVVLVVFAVWALCAEASRSDHADDTRRGDRW